MTSPNFNHSLFRHNGPADKSSSSPLLHPRRRLQYRCSFLGPSGIIVAGSSYHWIFSCSYSYSVKRYSYSKRSIRISLTKGPNTGVPASSKGDRLESIQALSSTSTSTATLSTRKPSFYPLKYLKGILVFPILTFEPESRSSDPP